MLHCAARVYSCGSSIHAVCCKVDWLAKMNGIVAFGHLLARWKTHQNVSFFFHRMRNCSSLSTSTYYNSFSLCMMNCNNALYNQKVKATATVHITRGLAFIGWRAKALHSAHCTGCKSLCWKWNWDAQTWTLVKVRWIAVQTLPPWKEYIWSQPAVWVTRVLYLSKVIK